MKQLKKYLLSIILIILLTFGSSCKRSSSNVNNENFDKLMDELFVQMLSDPLNANFLIKNLEEYGLEDLEVVPYDYSKEANDQYIEQITNNINQIKSFKIKTLSKEQQLTYEIVLDYFTTIAAFKDYYYFDMPLGSYLGYNAQLPIILSEYHFYTKKDIENYFEYLKTTRATFESMVEFEKEKKANGHAMPDHIIQGIIEQSNNFRNTEENYMIPVFNEKIDRLSFLTYQEKDEYKTLNKKYIEENFLPAYQYLSVEMEKLLGSATNLYGLSHYQYGKEYYQLLFKQATGTNISINEAQTYLNQALQSEFSRLGILHQYNNQIFDIISSPNLIETMSYDQILDFFFDNYVYDFMKIADVDIKVRKINPSLEENSSPAMYFLSPLDENVEEVIYVNDKIFTENPTYAFITLSHEGVPGHLLQHVTLKNSDLPNIRKMVDYNSYSEGWATYVEEYIGKYLDIDDNVIEAYFIYNRINYIIFCLADIGVNYNGWYPSQLESFLEDYFGDMQAEEVNDMFYQLVETPTNTMEYYFSYYQITDLKEKFVQLSKNKNYENVDYQFHKFYLEMGPAPFYIIEDQISDYINNN